MNRNEELRFDLFDIGENFPPGAPAMVLAESLVEIAKALNIRRGDFLKDVRSRLESLNQTFEDRTLLKPPTDQEYERCRRLVVHRIRRFSPGPTLDLLNVLLASLTDVVLKRGLPVDLAMGMLTSSWDGVPLVTHPPERTPRKRDLNGN